MECKCCMPTSAPGTPGQCSGTTAYLHTASTGSIRGLHNPRGASQGGGGEQGEEVVCFGRPVVKKQHIKSFSMGPAQHKQFHCLMAIHFINYEVPFIKLECPAWVSWVRTSSSMQAAMQRAVVAPAPAEESNQRWAAISTWERTARECLGRQACSSDHNAPDLKGQPVNVVFFQAAFQWDIKSCCERLRNRGMRGPAVLRHVPAHEKEWNPRARYSAISDC